MATCAIISASHLHIMGTVEREQIPQHKAKQSVVSTRNKGIILIQVGISLIPLPFSLT
jgi:hypothetical protein